MKTIPLLVFLPEETIPLLIVFGGLAFMFQAKKIATALFTICGLMVFLPILIEPLLEIFPDWALSLFLAFFWISMLGIVITLVIGKNAKDQMIGTLAADVFKWVLFSPFRILGRMFRTFRS